MLQFLLPDDSRFQPEELFEKARPCLIKTINLLREGLSEQNKMSTLSCIILAFGNKFEDFLRKALKSSQNKPPEPETDTEDCNGRWMLPGPSWMLINLSATNLQL